MQIQHSLIRALRNLSGEKVSEVTAHPPPSPKLRVRLRAYYYVEASKFKS